MTSSAVTGIWLYMPDVTSCPRSMRGCARVRPGQGPSGVRPDPGQGYSPVSVAGRGAVGCSFEPLAYQSRAVVTLDAPRERCPQGRAICGVPSLCGVLVRPRPGRHGPSSGRTVGSWQHCSWVDSASLAFQVFKYMLLQLTPKRAPCAYGTWTSVHICAILPSKTLDRKLWTETFCFLSRRSLR
jgi:hypothetical protein